MSDTAHWRKSSQSSGGTEGQCVELAVLRGAVGVRDSKDPWGSKLVLSRRQLCEFLRAVRNA